MFALNENHKLNKKFPLGKRRNPLIDDDEKTKEISHYDGTY